MSFAEHVSAKENERMKSVLYDAEIQLERAARRKNVANSRVRTARETLKDAEDEYQDASAWFAAAKTYRDTLRRNT